MKGSRLPHLVRVAPRAGNVERRLKNTRLSRLSLSLHLRPLGICLVPPLSSAFRHLLPSLRISCFPTSFAAALRAGLPGRINKPLCNRIVHR